MIYSPPDAYAAPHLARDALVAICCRFLDLVDAECRQLTLWEKSRLRLAIDHLKMGRWHLAWVALVGAVKETASIDSQPLYPDEAEALATVTAEQMRFDLAVIPGGPLHSKNQFSRFAS